MDIHYRENPWSGPQPTLCGCDTGGMAYLAYTDKPAKVTCAKCVAALKARAA